MTVAVLEQPRLLGRSAKAAATGLPGFLTPVLCVLVLTVLQRLRYPLPPLVIVAVGLPIMVLLFRSALTNALPVLTAITIYVPFSKVYVGGFGGLMPAFNLTNVLTVLAIVAWSTTKRQTGEPFFVRTALNGPLGLFYVLAGLSLILGHFHFGGGHVADAVVVLKRWLDPFFLFFFFVNIVRSREEIRYLTIVLLVTVFAAGVLAYFEHWDRLGFWGDRMRIRGLSLHSNTTAAFFAYYLFVFPALLFTLRFNWRTAIGLAIPALVCLRAIMFTGSRGALLAFAVAAGFLAFVRARTLFLCTAIIALVFYLNPAFLPEVVKARFGGLFKEEAVVELVDFEELEKSVSLRLVIWGGALRMIADAPVLGVGYGGFRRFIAEYTDGEVWSGLDAHNMYLLIAAEMGIPALLLFLALLGLVFREGWRLYHGTDDRFLRGLGLGLCAGIVALLVAGVFGSRFNSFELTGYFWILAALATRANLLAAPPARTGAPRGRLP